MGFFNWHPQGFLDFPTREHCDKQHTGSRSLGTPMTGMVCDLQQVFVGWGYVGLMVGQTTIALLTLAAGSYALYQRGNRQEADTSRAFSCN